MILHQITSMKEEDQGGRGVLMTKYGSNGAFVNLALFCYFLVLDSHLKAMGPISSGSLDPAHWKALNE